MKFVIQPLDIGTDSIVFDETNYGCTVNTVQECGCIHNHVPGCGAPKTSQLS